MSHFEVPANGAGRLESETVYFLNRASEERTLALHARHSDARRKHLHNAEGFEKRVRAIAGHGQRYTVAQSGDEGAHY
jgi:hypothetical protein